MSTETIPLSSLTRTAIREIAPKGVRSAFGTHGAVEFSTDVGDRLIVFQDHDPLDPGWAYRLLEVDIDGDPLPEVTGALDDTDDLRAVLEFIRPGRPTTHDDDSVTRCAYTPERVGASL